VSQLVKYDVHTTRKIKFIHAIIYHISLLSDCAKIWQNGRLENDSSTCVRGARAITEIYLPCNLKWGSVAEFRIFKSLQISREMLHLSETTGAMVGVFFLHVIQWAIHYLSLNERFGRDTLIVICSKKKFNNQSINIRLMRGMSKRRPTHVWQTIEWT